MYRFKIGFEREYFVMRQDKTAVAVVPSALPHDDCGWLFESRGSPCQSHTGVLDALYALKLADAKLSRQVAAHNERCKTIVDAVKLSVGIRSCMVVPRAVRDEARRTFTKGLVTDRNLYGHTAHRNRVTEGLAGLHVSLTHPRTWTDQQSKVEYVINQVWDFASFIEQMDKAFAEEIKAAKRRPGFYDVHPDGRFEYRSLPNNVNEDKLEDVIAGILRKIR